MSNWQKISTNSNGYSTEILRNDEVKKLKQSLIVGTASTGMVRVEWIQARYGQIIPTNWSWVQMWQYMAPGQFMALGYQVDDAQNLIMAKAVEGEYDYVLLYEHDMLPEPDALVRLNEYMKQKTEPVVSALYFTRSIPSEPMVYKGLGTGAYEDFDIGDIVRVDGVPTGFLLIHMSIIRAMWEESEPYMIGSVETRRIFNTPSMAWYDPESGQYNTQAGTSDLAWSHRVIDGGFLAKAGWPEHQAMEYPFIVDTNIMCNHINNDFAGTQFPPGGVRRFWQMARASRTPAPPTLGINVTDGVGIGEATGR